MSRVDPDCQVRPFEPVPEPNYQANPPVARSNPRLNTPNDDTSTSPCDAGCPGEETLAEQLSVIVDEARAEYTAIGLRPYRVFSVIVQWSGGIKGRGVPSVVSETEILPRPWVTTEKLKDQATSSGIQERGMMKIKHISLRYTEDDIRALFFEQPVTDPYEGFIEVRIDSRDGNPVRRRFVTKSAPYRNEEKFYWSCDLIEQDQARSRSGRFDDVSNQST